MFEGSLWKIGDSGDHRQGMAATSNQPQRSDECLPRKYLLLLRIESYKSAGLNIQINHMFSPKTVAPSFISPLFISHISDNPYRIIHIG